MTFSYATKCDTNISHLYIITNVYNINTTSKSDVKYLVSSTITDQ